MTGTHGSTPLRLSATRARYSGTLSGVKPWWSAAVSTFRQVAPASTTPLPSSMWSLWVVRPTCQLRCRARFGIVRTRKACGPGGDPHAPSDCSLHYRNIAKVDRGPPTRRAIAHEVAVESGAIQHGWSDLVVVSCGGGGTRRDLAGTSEARHCFMGIVEVDRLAVARAPVRTTGPCTSWRPSLPRRSYQPSSGFITRQMRATLEALRAFDMVHDGGLADVSVGKLTSPERHSAARSTSGPKVAP